MNSLLQFARNLDVAKSKKSLTIGPELGGGVGDGGGGVLRLS